MLKLFTRLRRYIHGSSKGFTLIELLVTFIVSGIVLSLALRLIVDQRQLYVQDQARTQINQNLRAAIDLVGTDIKQTGERLVGNTQFPVVQIINNGSGVGTADKLVVQRNLVDQALPVCRNISPGSITTSSTTSPSTIDVSVNAGAGNPPLASCPFSNGNASATPPDSWPDNLEQWRNARCSKDGISGCQRLTNVANDGCVEQGGTDRECLWVYIYNPATNTSEFFLYTFEDSYLSGTQTRYRIYRGLSTLYISKNVWTNTYGYDSTKAPYTNNPVLYVLEEREYKLVQNSKDPTTDLTKKDRVLQLIVNRQTAAPVGLVNQLEDFQVKASVQGSTTLVDSFNATANKTSPFYSSSWRTIQSIQVDLTAKNLSHVYTPRNTSYLKLSSQFFPRNAASKQ